MTRLPRSNDAAGPRLASIESLLAAGVAVGLLFIGISVAGYGTTYSQLRLVALDISVGAVFLAFMSALIHRRAQADVLAILAILYFVWSGIQDASQADTLGAILDLVGASMSYAATLASLRKVLSGLRRWILVVVITSLLPALLGQGFGPGRVWFGLTQGRYFGFSNPDALGFIAGLALLLSLPVLRFTHGRILAALSGLLYVISATNTAAIATGAAVAAYYFVAKNRATRHLRGGAAVLAAVTVGVLTWIPTNQAMNAFESLSQKISLSSRTLLWFELLQSARDSGYFWTGMGDGGVAHYTVAILGVATAHTTILQMLLSKGFFTTVFFIVVAVVAANRTLGKVASKPSRDHCLAFAVVIYWFVTSLVSTQPGTPLGLMLLVLIAIPHPDDESESDRSLNANLDDSGVSPDLSRGGRGRQRPRQTAAQNQPFGDGHAAAKVLEALREGSA